MVAGEDSELEFWFWDFDRGHPCGGAGELDLAFVDAVSGGNEEGVLVEVTIVDASIDAVGFR